MKTHAFTKISSYQDNKVKTFLIVEDDALIITLLFPRLP